MTNTKRRAHISWWNKMLYELAVVLIFFLALGAMVIGSIQNVPECTPTQTVYERMRSEPHGAYGWQDQLLWQKAKKYNLERGCPK